MRIVKRTGICVLPLTIALLVGTTAIGGSAAWGRAPHGLEYERPVDCPTYLPHANWSSTYSAFPITWRLPGWALPEGDEIPFTVRAMRNVSPYLIVGEAWFTPNPVAETTLEGRRWTWEAAGGQPGVRFRCDRYEVTWAGVPMYWLQMADPTNELRGYAFPNLEQEFRIG